MWTQGVEFRFPSLEGRPLAATSTKQFLQYTRGGPDFTSLSTKKGVGQLFKLVENHQEVLKSVNITPFLPKFPIHAASR